MIRNAKVGDRVGIEVYNKHGVVIDVIILKASKEKLIKVRWQDNTISSHEPRVLKRE